MITTIFYILLVLFGLVKLDIVWVIIALFFDAFLGGWFARIFHK